MLIISVSSSICFYHVLPFFSLQPYEFAFMHVLPFFILTYGPKDFHFKFKFIKQDKSNIYTKLNINTYAR